MPVAEYILSAVGNFRFNTCLFIFDVDKKGYTAKSLKHRITMFVIQPGTQDMQTSSSLIKVHFILIIL